MKKLHQRAGAVPCLNPKGILAQSPRLPRSGYLGSAFNDYVQPQRGCGQRRPLHGAGNCHHRVAVGELVGTLTQGRLADSPTLGFEPQSLWDCQNGRASGRQDACKARNALSFALWALGLGLGIFVLAGCAVGPNYQRPKVAAPAAFRGATEISTNSFADLPWWRVFHDDTLQQLVRVALTNNYDLRIAVTRVEQARALAAQARSQFFPQLNYALLAGKGRNVSDNAPSPTGTGGAVFGADVNASWEIDLWGRLRRLNESAHAQWRASEEARRDVTISLIAQVAQDYLQLLALDQQLAIARQTTNSFGASLKIFDERLRGGVASKLETASAEALMDAAAATIPELEQQIQLQEN